MKIGHVEKCYSVKKNAFLVLVIWYWPYEITWNQGSVENAHPIREKCIPSSENAC